MENLHIVVFKRKFDSRNLILYYANNEKWAEKEKGFKLLLPPVKTIVELVENISKKIKADFPNIPYYEIYFETEGMNLIEVDSRLGSSAVEGLSKDEREEFWVELSKKH